MNPIDTLFKTLRAAGRKAFIPFLPAGDPDLAFTGDLLPRVAAAGASLIEIGFPFSDPIADGPTIQASYTRALSKRVALADIFATTRRAEESGVGVPMMAMASYSLIWKKGPEAFLREALASGIVGAVVPDLPVEEAADLGAIAKDLGFALTLLVTPTTSPERAAKIAAACTGFVYVVSLVGITGQQAAAAPPIEAMMARLRSMTDRPLCVGFGVSRPEHVRAFAPLCDGVIVGTALVKQIESAGTPERRAAAADAVVELVRELAGSLPA